MSGSRARSSNQSRTASRPSLDDDDDDASASLPCRNQSSASPESTSVHSIESYRERLGRPRRPIDWRHYETRVNLPALLNDPRRRRPPLDFFTKTWGDSFVEQTVKPSPLLPAINRHSFSDYLDELTRREHRLRRRQVRSTGAESSAPSTAPSPIPDDIPPIYFSNAFQLSDPATFQRVIPWSLFESDRQDGTMQMSVRIHHDKLAHFLDQIEVQVAQHVARRAEGFFNVVQNHDELSDELAKACNLISHLREHLAMVDREMFERAREQSRKAVRRRRCGDVLVKLQTMSAVQQTQPTLQILLSQCDYVAALELIATTREVLDAELSGVQCFRHLPHQLSEMELLIDKMLQQDFIKLLSAELNRPLSDGWETSIDRARFSAVLFGLLRKKRFQFSQWFRREATGALGATLKLVLFEAIASSEDDVAPPSDPIDGVNGEPNGVGGPSDSAESAERKTTLEARLRSIAALDFLAWSALLRRICDGSVTMLRRLESSVLLIIECSERVTMPSTAVGSDPDGLEADPEHQRWLSDLDRTQILVAIRESFHSLAGDVQETIADLVIERIKRGAGAIGASRPSWSDFRSLASTLSKFGADLRRLELRHSTIRSCQQELAGRFIAAFDDERRERLELLIQSERWTPAEIPADFQVLVDLLAQSDDAPDFETASRIMRRQSNGSDKLERLRVGDDPDVALPSIAPLFLEILVEYCQRASEVHVALTCRAEDDERQSSGDAGPAVELLVKRALDMLRLFNSRTCQLILAAGAVQLGEKRSITGRDLALSTRALEFVRAHIAPIQRHLAALLNDDATTTTTTKRSPLVKRFDEISGEYADHERRNLEKIAAVMDSYICKYLHAWQCKAPTPQQQWVAIGKKFQSLHDNLGDVLSRAQLLELLAQAHRIFKQRLREALAAQAIAPDGGPRHGLVAQEWAFYMRTVRQLDAVARAIAVNASTTGGGGGGVDERPFYCDDGKDLWN